MAGAKTLIRNGVAQGDFDMAGFDLLNAGNVTGGGGDDFGVQAAHTVFAGPTVGGPAIPAFRFLFPADYPLAMLGTNNLSELTVPATARTALGLTAAATAASSATGRLILNVDVPALEGINFLTSTDAVPGWMLPNAARIAIGAEAALGNPATTGFVLSSTNTGTRIWVQRVSITGSEAITNKIVNGMTLVVGTAAAGEAGTITETQAPANPFTFRIAAISQTGTSLTLRTTAPTNLVLPPGPGTVALVAGTIPAANLNTNAGMKPGVDTDVPSQLAVLRFVNARTGGNLLPADDDTEAAVAGVLDLDSTSGYQIGVSGATITSITLADGEEKLTRFVGATAITHSPTLLLPGGISFTTAAGNWGVVRGYSGGVVKLLKYETGSVGVSEGQRLSMYGGKIQRLSSLEFVKDVPASRIYFNLDMGGDAVGAVHADLSGGSVFGIKSRLAGGGTGAGHRLTAADFYTIVTDETIGGSGSTASGADTLVVTTDTDQGSVNRLRGIVNTMFADGDVSDAVVLVNAIDNTLRTVGGACNYLSAICQSNSILAATAGSIVNDPILFKGQIAKASTGTITGTAKGVSLENWSGAPTTSYGIYADASIGIGTTAYFIYSLSTAPSLLSGQLQLRAGATGADTAPLKFSSGALNTAAKAGSMEFLNDGYYGSITTGDTRKQFAFLDGNTQTSTAAGTTTLTAASTQMQTFVGSTTQTVILPLASTLSIGQTFTICNFSSPATGSDDGGATTEVTVKNNAGTTLIAIPGVTVVQSIARRPQVATFKCIGTTTGTGSWIVTPNFLSTAIDLGTSDTKASSQKAIKTYVDARIGGGLLPVTAENSVVSAATLNLDAHDGAFMDITGTTNITAITLAEGREVVLRFTNATPPKLINGATLITPGAGQDVVTTQNGYAIVRGGAVGVVTVTKYQTPEGYSQEQFDNIYINTFGNIGFKETGSPSFYAGKRDVTDTNSNYLIFSPGDFVTLRNQSGTGNAILDTSALDGDRTFTFSNRDGGTIPPGGTTGQVLKKASNADYDVVWATP